MAPLRTFIAVMCLGAAPLGAALALTVPPEAFAQAGGATQVQLKVGGRRSVSVQNVTRVAVGDPEIADIRVAGGEVEITGRAPGTTQLLVWRGDGSKQSYAITVSR